MPFNGYIGNYIILKHKIINKTLVFKNRRELVKYLSDNLTNKPDFFEKDILSLRKEELVYKYLKNYYISI
jgi:hypothetical protein